MPIELFYKLVFSLLTPISSKYFRSELWIVPKIPNTTSFLLYLGSCPTDYLWLKCWGRLQSPYGFLSLRSEMRSYREGRLLTELMEDMLLKILCFPWWHASYLIKEPFQHTFMEAKKMLRSNCGEWLIGKNNLKQQFSITSSSSGADLSPF